ncbi:hypothetical protein RhiirA4_479564 [Rhizophagus irregularis]|uniref:Ion transport domain-containing protein n=2 Tax=Rhizophagus irregularis TaxID=588596 RepID=A0A2I1HGN0_9GLOM|nr:hypothetical protein RhiirA4_479564 [Rhizophagus irregularis]
MTRDIECGDQTYGEKISYVAISPDGSMVATFNPYSSSILITKVVTSETLTKIRFDRKKFFDKVPPNILGWSLAVSDIIDAENNIGLIAISCMTDEDMNPKLKILPRKLNRHIKLNKLNTNIITREESDCILPGNLYKELESINDAKHNWIYLLKSRYQEFLMVVTNEYQQTQNIEIYNINTSQLVNVFHRLYGDEDFLVLNNSKPGIFAISTDSRLFAYSYGNNIITIYLMESGLEVVSKKFNNIHKIKFLEFIAKDRKLFVIEEDKENDVKFHIWLISGCLNDYFPISRDDLNLSDNDISTLLKYDGYYHILTKANGKIVTLEKDNEDQFRVLSDIFTKSVIFKENDSVIDEFKYNYSHDNLEPWNNSAGSIRSIRGKFLNNDKSLLYLIGQNSIQVWKSKSQTFKDFEDFKSFENSNLVYILISDSIKPAKLQIDDDMITVITHAYFIKRYPDNWKLMEVQYPLMAYLIYSRSFSLIKYILFGVNDQISSQKKNSELLHRPQNKYVSYPYYNDLKLYDDLKFKNDNLKSANDLELALKFCQDRDAVMLAYLLEYYSENSMAHIGWMINVTKILPELPANYAELLYYKPCFGGIKYNFPNRRFKELPVSDDTLDLKVSLPLTRLKATKSLSFLKYKIIGDEELHNIYMVPLPNFVTHGTEIKEKSRVKFGTIYYWLRKILLPPGYKDLNDKDFSPFLRINKKNKSAFFNVPVVEAVITSRWEQTKNYWMIPLLIYSTFLALFAYLPPFLLDGNDELGGSIDIINMINMGVFYYAGLYLLIAEIMQMKKYKTEYFTLFNIFDLCSILLGIIVFTLIIVKSFDETNRINGEGIVILMTVTTLILWIEMLFWLLGHSMLVFFGYPSLLNLNPTASNFTLNNGTGNFTLTGESPNNPFDTIWDAILSAYYWNAINLSPYNYWPLKLFAFFANIILVLVLLNMIIALMNDTFNKAKEDGKLGLLMYRVELINDYERLNDPFFSVLLNNNSPYICFYQNPDLMKKWITKSQELKDIKLYSWYNENVDKEEITFDDENDTINLWYALITGDKTQNSASSLSIPDHMTLWF